jgi:hypothetical protein
MTRRPHVADPDELEAINEGLAGEPGSDAELAEHYRQVADRLQREANIAETETMRDQLRTIARRFDQLAEAIKAPPAAEIAVRQIMPAASETIQIGRGATK